MTTISPGSLCTVKKFGTILWVVQRPAENGRWVLTAKQTDGRGRAAYRGHTAGAGDIHVIRAAPTYKIGGVVERDDGRRYVVLRDLGAEVELAVPEDRVPLRGGYTIHVKKGNSTLVSKADLALAMFGKINKE